VPSQYLPGGIATQDEKTAYQIYGKPEMVIAYFRSLAEEVRNRLRSLASGRSANSRAGTTAQCAVWNDPFLVVPISPRIALRRSRSPASTSRPWKIRFISMLR